MNIKSKIYLVLFFLMNIFICLAMQAKEKINRDPVKGEVVNVVEANKLFVREIPKLFNNS